MKVSNLFFLLLFSYVYWSAFAQQSSPGKKNDFAGVNARGDQGMGFSHEKRLIISISWLTAVPSRFKATTLLMQLAKRLSAGI